MDTEDKAYRETKEDKIDYTLLPLNQIKKLAIHFTEWAKSHWPNNRMKGDKEFMEGCKKSAFRHFIQWMMWETDENHLQAAIWNMMIYEELKEILYYKQ